MQSEYIVSSECISTILHRLSLGLGDFEGFLYGTKQIINSSKLKDDGSYENKSVTMIHNVFIFSTQKIVFGASQIAENIRECPQNMQVVGWISGRREVPAMISLGDKSTYVYISQLTSRFPESISPDLIFGLFTSKNTLGESAGDIEIGKCAVVTPFEFKFFNPKENFSSLKIDIENLQETQSKYNGINFTYSLAGSRSQELCSKAM